MGVDCELIIAEGFYIYPKDAPAFIRVLNKIEDEEFENIFYDGFTPEKKTILVPTNIIFKGEIFGVKEAESTLIEHVCMDISHLEKFHPSVKEFVLKYAVYGKVEFWHWY